MKEDAVEFLKQDRLEDLVSRYSEFITFPIKLYKKTQEIVEEEEGEGEEEEGEGEEDASDESKATSEDGLEVEEEEEDKPAAETKTEKV